MIWAVEGGDLTPTRSWSWLRRHDIRHSELLRDCNIRGRSSRDPSLRNAARSELLWMAILLRIWKIRGGWLRFPSRRGGQSRWLRSPCQCQRANVRHVYFWAWTCQRGKCYSARVLSVVVFFFLFSFLNGWLCRIFMV